MACCGLLWEFTGFYVFACGQSRLDGTWRSQQNGLKVETKPLQSLAAAPKALEERHRHR